MTRSPDFSSSPMYFHVHESIDQVRARIDVVLQAPLDAPVVTSAALELPRIFGERSGDEYHLRTVGDTRSPILSVGILTLASTSDGTELQLRFRDGAWASVPLGPPRSDRSPLRRDPERSPMGLHLAGSRRLRGRRGRDSAADRLAEGSPKDPSRPLPDLSGSPDGRITPGSPRGHESRSSLNPALRRRPSFAAPSSNPTATVVASPEKPDRPDQPPIRDTSLRRRGA